jgi:hypothetical protein
MPSLAAAVDSGWVDDAIRFRCSVGLEADRAFVASTFGREGYSADEFGVPLSDDEVALILERQARTAKAQPGHDWAQRQPGFAGAWTDQTRDGLIVYQFSAEPEVAQAELDRLLPPEVTFEVRLVERDINDLQGLKRSIAADIPMLEGAGIEVTSVGLDIRANTIRVGVAEGVDLARGLIQATHGSFIEVVGEDPGQADTRAGSGKDGQHAGGIRESEEGPGSTAQVTDAVDPCAFAGP